MGFDIVFPEEAAFETRFGVRGKGATLIRPDGIVAWRTDKSADGEELRRVIAQIVSARAR